jgi:hypothetical protein
MCINEHKSWHWEKNRDLVVWFILFLIWLSMKVVFDVCFIFIVFCIGRFIFHCGLVQISDTTHALFASWTIRKRVPICPTRIVPKSCFLNWTFKYIRFVLLFVALFMTWSYIRNIFQVIVPIFYVHSPPPSLLQLLRILWYLACHDICIIFRYF